MTSHLNAFAPCVVPGEPRLTENALKVLQARYLKKNEAGQCEETPAALFWRVAAHIAAAERLYGATSSEQQAWTQRFYDLMARGHFMPNSPTLMNAGREMGMLSACFVLPVRDSINEIFDSIKHTALIQKAGGGTGFAFDELRPTGDYIASSGGTTSGPISFWRAFSEATNAIQQGAFRRGANMGMMYVHHPDILKFLHAKQDLNQFTNYNISVKITDAWMEEFLADPDSPQVVRNPRTGKAFVIPRDVDVWKYDVRSLIEIDCVDPVAAVPDAAGTRPAYYTAPRLTGRLPAHLAGKVYTKRDIWSFIIEHAWQTGEPGVVFIDRINEANPTPHIGRMEATNPCGEQPLLPYEACNLGSINLGAFIRNACSSQAEVDWPALRDCVHLSTRFLDDVIDVNNYPLEQIDAICKGNRKIGLGIMGFADALYKLNVPYNSDAGVAWGERFMKFVNDEAHNYSEQLARLRGVFPNWYGSRWQSAGRPMRNACVTTVAPTGTISIIANCSGGVEPMFSLAFLRNVLRGQKQGEKPLIEVNDTFVAVARERGFYSEALLERIATEGTLAHIDAIPEDVRRVFVCAHDVTPDWHMQMQAAFQRHNDSSISKTINFPTTASVEDVERIYRLAFELRCKGVTVYRDGCRSHQPMALKDSDKKHAQRAKKPARAPHAAVAPALPLASKQLEAAVAEHQANPLASTALRPGAGPARANPADADCTEPASHGDGHEAPQAPCGTGAGDSRSDGGPAHAARAAGNGSQGLAVQGNGAKGHRPATLRAESYSEARRAATPPTAPPVLATPAARVPGGPSTGPAGSIKPSAVQAGSIEPGAVAASFANQTATRNAAAEAAAARRTPPLEPQDLPAILSGLRIRQMTPFGNMHVKITVDPRSDRELEVFAQLGKGGDVATSDLEAICRMISLWLRSGGTLKHVVKQLEGIGSSLQIPTRMGRIMSLGDGLACALKKYVTAKQHFGLRAILLGEIDPAELDNPTPKLPGRVVVDRALADRALDQAPLTNGGNGHAPQPPHPQPNRDREGAGFSPPQPNRDREREAFDPHVQASEGLLLRESILAANGNGHADALDSDMHAHAEPPESDLHDPTDPDAGMVMSAPLGQESDSAPQDATAVVVRRARDIAQGYRVHCPECDSELALQEGCRKCHSCGWSAC